MDTQIFLLMVCAVIFVLSLPLVFKLVPPNRIYGFRTRRTLSRDDIWYRANVFAGLALMAATAIAATVILSVPLSDVTAIVVFVALVLCALAASFAYLKYLR